MSSSIHPPAVIHSCLGVLDPLLSKTYRNAKEFILQFPDSGFTTMRTVNRRNILEWPTHLERLREPALCSHPASYSLELTTLIGAATSHQTQKEILSAETEAVFQPITAAAIKDMINQQTPNSDTHEFRIYAVASGKYPLEVVKESAVPSSVDLNRKIFCWVYAELMPAPVTDNGRVRVEARICHRQDPTIKSISWVT